MSEPARKLSAQDLVNATRQQMLKEVLEVVNECAVPIHSGALITKDDLIEALKERFGDE